MKEFIYRIRDEHGMHARPAGKLAAYAKQFESEVRVTCRDQEVDVKRLLSLLSLGAVCGTELRFSVAGPDEEAAAHALERFCREDWEKGGLL